MAQMFKRVSKPQLIFLRLQHSNQNDTYAGLCWIAEDRGYNVGWISHKFHEIYGEWPKYAAFISAAMPSEDLVSWVANGQRKYGMKLHRQAMARSVFGARALDRIEAILADLEATDRETGGEYRDDCDIEEWEAMDVIERIEARMQANGCTGYDTLAERDMDRPSLIERLSDEA